MFWRVPSSNRVRNSRDKELNKDLTKSFTDQEQGDQYFNRMHYSHRGWNEDAFSLRHNHFQNCSNESRDDIEAIRSEIDQGDQEAYFLYRDFISLDDTTPPVLSSLETNQCENAFATISYSRYSIACMSDTSGASSTEDVEIDCESSRTYRSGADSTRKLMPFYTDAELIAEAAQELGLNPSSTSICEESCRTERRFMKMREKSQHHGKSKCSRTRTSNTRAKSSENATEKYQVDNSNLSPHERFAKKKSDETSTDHYESHIHMIDQPHGMPGVFEESRSPSFEQTGEQMVGHQMLVGVNLNPASSNCSERSREISQQHDDHDESLNWSEYQNSSFSISSISMYENSDHYGQGRPLWITKERHGNSSVHEFTNILVDLIRRRKYKLALQRLDYFPDEACMTSVDNDLALHKLLREMQTIVSSVKNEDKYKLQLLWALIGATPNALSRPGNGGYLPLHIACIRLKETRENQVNQEMLVAIIRELLVLNPEAASNHENETGELPLHIVARWICYNDTCWSQNDMLRSGEQIATYLILLASIGVSVKDKHGKNPMDILSTFLKSQIHISRENARFDYNDSDPHHLVVEKLHDLMVFKFEVCPFPKIAFRDGGSRRSCDRQKKLRSLTPITGISELLEEKETTGCDDADVILDKLLG